MRRYEITRYEIIAKHEQTGKIWLIGYTPRKSRPGMLAAMRNVGDAMIAKLELTDETAMSWSRRCNRFAAGVNPCCHVGQWHVFFSGHTQRDCRGCEHPFIAAKTA
jgi:hypothetical protein